MTTTYLSLLGVVGVEWETFDHESVGEEENGDIVENFEALHFPPHRLNSLLLGNKVELFDPALQHFSVDLSRHVAAVLRRLELQLFFNALGIEFALILLPFISDPL